MTIERPDLGHEVLDQDHLEGLGADRVLAEVKKHCDIIFIKVRSWEGQYLMDGADVAVDGQPVPPKFRTKSHWKVEPDAWHKALVPFASKVRTEVRKVAVNFSDGVYIVPRKRVRDLMRAIQRIRSGYRETAAYYATKYPALLEALARPTTEDGMGTWFARIQKKLPRPDQFARLYDIEVGFWPVGGGSEAGRFDADEIAEWAGEAQESTRRMIEEAVRNMVAEPAAEFAAAVANLEEVAGNSRARNGTIDMVRRAYEKLLGFSFMMPNELVERLRGIGSRLAGLTPVGLNSATPAANVLTNTLKAISAELSSHRAYAEAFGASGPRPLDLD